MSQTNPITPYASVHTAPQGPGDARPTALQIVRDENLLNKWDNKTVFITGGSSGIGVETARALHTTGARVFITTRDIAKAEAVTKDILSTSPSKVPVEIIHMELNSLSSVRAGAEEFLKRSDRLNVLINNAGVMASPQSKTEDGFDGQFGTNHLAHFLLVNLLLPTLQASATPEFASRVVNVSSAGHHYAVGGLTDDVLADLDFSKTAYDPWVSYGRSKLANIWHANQIDRLHGSDQKHPVHAFSLHPGGITTELWRHLDSTPEAQFNNIWKSVEQGAATTVWCATAALLEGKGAMYCEDCGESHQDPEDVKMGDPGFAIWAHNADGEKKLWDISEKMVGSVAK
jgi:NAD(P)-dependent dehydrogenase (short-subunit alcohol dehydrogenase family)